MCMLHAASPHAYLRSAAITVCSVPPTAARADHHCAPLPHLRPPCLLTVLLLSSEQFGSCKGLCAPDHRTKAASATGSRSSGHAAVPESPSARNSNCPHNQPLEPQLTQSPPLRPKAGRMRRGVLMTPRGQYLASSGQFSRLTRPHYQ